MNKALHHEVMEIVQDGIRAVLPDQAVKKAMAQLPQYRGRLLLVAAGKAAWQMAYAACQALADTRRSDASAHTPAGGSGIDAGIVITKYDHVKGPLPGIRCFEAGHPVPDENGFAATEQALALVRNLTEDDLVLFLLSGGGSALFEKPLIPGAELQSITQALLASGANITEINTIRKHLSAVKGGRFAEIASPAQIFTIVLSDIVGDPLDMIASGPAYPDSTTSQDALRIAERYALPLSDKARAALLHETPKQLDNVRTVVTGSVRELCVATAKACRKLGYEPVILTDHLECEARIAGRDLGRLAAAVASQALDRKPGRIALIAGGETVVHLTGAGLGGRNQELALAAASSIQGLPGVAIFSVGSDGTDGPTEAAGGYVDGDTIDALQARGISADAVLANNDSYHALAAADGLIITGPTGTNVNDVTVALVTR